MTISSIFLNSGACGKEIGESSNRPQPKKSLFGKWDGSLRQGSVLVPGQ